MRIQRTEYIKESEVKPHKVVDLTLMNNLIEKYKGHKGSMIPLLQGAMGIYGYIPHEVFIKLSEETDLKLNDMYGVATFYAQFRLHPVGKHIIKVSHGTACHVQNANAVTETLQNTLGVKDGQTTEDGLFTLESVACLGCCSLAPVMMIGDETFAKLGSKEVVNAIKNIRIKEGN